MKSDINNELCKECYTRAKQHGVLLPCEATGCCIKNEKEFRRFVNEM